MIAPVPHFKDILKEKDRILGLDIGTKTIGLAMNIVGSSLVTPLDIIRRKKYSQDIQTLQSIVKEWDIKGLVIGLPLHMDGTEGRKVQSVKTTSRNIARDTSLPYCFQDERLSTVTADHRMMDIGLKYKARQDTIDSHAAKIILENYINI